jgi:transposase InsO family protein
MSSEYRELLADLDMVQSVGRTGVCWDNAVAESFWSSLKRELVARYRFPTRADARRAIFAWTNRYNQHRLHSSLDYRPPSNGNSYTVNPEPTRPRNQRDRSTGGSSDIARAPFPVG